MTERSMEHWVLDDLGIKTDDLVNQEKGNFWIIPQGETERKEIKYILKKSGGKPKISPLTELKLNEKESQGKPEYIFQHKNKKLILIVECKDEETQHKQKEDKRDKPRDYNVDGILYYAKYFKEKFDVLCLAISGYQRNKCKISFFDWNKGEKLPNEEREQHKLYLVEEYFAIYDVKKQPIEYGKVRKIARELNETFRSENWRLTERTKPFFISACLIALSNNKFRSDFSKGEEYLRKEYEEKHGVTDLVSFCKLAIEWEVEKFLIEEKENKKEKYKNLRINLQKIIGENKKIKKGAYFANILQKIKEDVYPYLVEGKGDIIGQFYHEFLKYSSGADGTILGITLTPSHIAELFCDLALKLLYPEIEESKRKFTKKDKILDICLGTGTFLVSALSKGASRNNIYGIESDDDVFSLALINMILWQDGRSDIYNVSCFDKDNKERDKIEDKIRKAKCNIGFLNPPYSQKKKKDSEGKTEIEFIHHHCNLLEKNSFVFAIVPLSVATGNTDKEERKAIMKQHTLEAVMTMPNNLFAANASGSHTCIMVWRTGTTHNENNQTWLANWKDDKFIVKKGKREPKSETIWQEEKKKWLDMYHQESIPHVSTFQNLTAEEPKKDEKTNTCWLADAYVETDYSPLTKEGGEFYFEKTVRNYLAFLVSNFHSPIKRITSLNTNNWKYFYLNEKEGFFKIRRGKWKEALARTSPKILFDCESVIPIISSSQENNGVDNFIKKNEREDIETNPKNRITIANNGSVGETFFQPLDFQATSDITILELVNQELNEYIAFFLCSIIKMEHFRYSWGRKWGLEEMRNSRIKLPQDENGRPDWKFMENYSKEIFSKVKENIYQIIEAERERERERRINNSIPNWEEVRLIDYFYISRAKITRREDILPGEFIHITDKSNFNGYESSSHVWTEEGKVISVGTYSGNSFYQETQFVNSSHQLIKIQPKNKELNKYTALFIATILNLGAFKYSYGRMRSLQEIKKEKLLLPISKNKEIDWEHIENMMKNLYKEVTIGLEKDLESIESKVIWKIAKKE